MKSEIFCWLAALISVEALALYSLQRYAKRPSDKKWMAIAMVVYGVGVTYLLYKCLSFKGVGLVNFLWNVFSTISGFMIGILLFSEKVNNMQWMGVTLSLLGLALIILADGSA